MSTTVAVRLRRLSGVLAAAALGGGVTAALVVPSASASKDPCTASEVTRTVGSVVTSTGDYLDAHPETNQVMTSALQQPPGPQSVAKLGAYFNANPKVADEFQKLTEPLTTVTEKCRLGISLPQMLGLLQAVQGQSGPSRDTATQPVPLPPVGVLR